MTILYLNANGGYSYTPQSFGAKGDGLTDDTTAIQDTLDIVSTLGGGQVLFPAGTYITGALTLPTKVSLIGYGAKVSILKCSLATGALITLASSNNCNQIINLKLWDSAASNTATAIKGTGVTRDLRLDSFEIEGFLSGVDVYDGVNHVIGQGRFLGQGAAVANGRAVKIGDTATANSTIHTKVDSYISGYYYGVDVQGGSSTCIGGIFENCTRPILAAQRTVVAPGTHFEGNAAATVLIEATGAQGQVIAYSPIAYESGAYLTSWDNRILGRVSIVLAPEV